MFTRRSLFALVMGSAGVPATPKRVTFARFDMSYALNPFPASIITQFRVREAHEEINRARSAIAEGISQLDLLWGRAPLNPEFACRASEIDKPVDPMFLNLALGDPL